MCLVALNKFSECLWILSRNLEEDMKNPDLYVLCASFYERFGQVWLLVALLPLLEPEDAPGSARL